MNRLAALPIPTVAAIHGAAVGGGYEICLACDYRVASPDRATKIGLPETNIGLLPAWGGATRLPRLIGLPKALDFILAGKTVPRKTGVEAAAWWTNWFPPNVSSRPRCEKSPRGKPRRPIALAGEQSIGRRRRLRRGCADGCCEKRAAIIRPS